MKCRSARALAVTKIFVSVGQHAPRGLTCELAPQRAVRFVLETGGEPFDQLQVRLVGVGDGVEPKRVRCRVVSDHVRLDVLRDRLIDEPLAEL
jgi:hypothetical protein